MKNKSLVVAASFAFMLAVGVSTASADGMNEPWGCTASFFECLVQGVINVL